MMKKIFWVIIPYIMIFVRWKELKTWQKTAGIIWSLVLLAFMFSDNSNDNNVVKNNENESIQVNTVVSEEKVEEEVKEEPISTEFSGELSTKVDGTNFVVEVKTNAVDGSVIDIMIVSGDLEIMETKAVTITNGRGEAIFDASKWKPNQLGVTGIFQFNAENKPQPENVRAVYGDYGEKLTGENINPNNKGGYNGEIKTITVYYPNEETVKQERLKDFGAKIQEIIKLSNGLILEIGPKYQDKGWGIIRVVVSDDWYFAPKFEQERFAETVGNTIETLVIGYEVAESPLVVFEDSFGKTIAERKLLGGYKIVE